LAFTSVLLLNFRQAKQNAGDESADRPTEINLLRDHDNPDTAVTPLR
jgi:hypothetical protein